MFTTDELEAAGQRAASHPVEAVPDVADIQREVARRRQSKRLLVGASTATFVLFGIGGLLLFSARDNQVQVITASPVLESEAQDSDLAGQEARTGADGGSDAVIDDDADGGTDGASGTAGEDGEDGAAGEGSSASSSSTSEADGGDVTNGYTTTIDGDEDADDDLDDERSDDRSDPDLDHFAFALPEDMKEWLEELKDWDHDDGQWQDYDLWPFGFDKLDLEISVGQEALDQAAAARSNADDVYLDDGQTIWIERRLRGNERRNTVTVSTLVDDEWFVIATGPADQESTLLLLISRYDGDWEEGLIPEDLDWMRDRDWLRWPPTEDDFEDWEDAREDWLKQQEELLKDSQEQVEEARKRVEEERKRIEEERKRIEEERNNDDDDDDDDDD